MTATLVARLRPVGDAALSAEFEPRVEVAINRAAVAVGARVRAAAIAGVRDVVVSTCAVTVYVDPLAVDWRGLEALLTSPVTPGPDASEAREPVIVPVTYGGEEGPDLDEVARRCGCPAGEVVARHTARPYRVFMLGFMPGFAYLGPLDESLRLPRRATPRLRVPAGSVAIAGEQTAVYPLDTPGGWWIIGRTSLRVFDPERDPPVLFDVGRAVRFEAR
jgi:inhibitor of KinA